MNNNPSPSNKSKADQYNDPTHNYLHYWEGRDYENDAEQIAISRLLKNKKFHNAVDIGGGYGRLCVFLEKYAEKVTLAEPSQQQLDIAVEFLKNNPEIQRCLTQADSLTLPSKSFDLLTMIRVMHHLPDPSESFKELARVLTDDGYLILEIANYAHARNRIKHIVRGKKIPTEPVDIRSENNRNDKEIAFVNHNPKTVIKQLAHAGLKVEKVLSVSNLRSQSIKKVLPKTTMLRLETLLQAPLAKAYFGPSIFMLIKKAS
ncbi:MAG: hypothetical protein NVS3B23_05720 [Candidatus Saccharimonadales bacterium]